MASASPPSVQDNRTEVPAERSARDGRRAEPRGSLLLGAILIALGLLLLVANVLGLGTGDVILLGLGLAFLIGRVTTRNYGLAVPAGILLGIGAFVALEDAGRLPGEEGGWFFLLMGLGFLAIYVIGWRPEAIWPLFPAVASGLFGLALLGWLSLAPLAPYAWLASYWPIALMAIGLWLLLRDRVPADLRAPLALLGGILLLAYGLIAVAAVVAAELGPTAPGTPDAGVRVPGFAPFSETVTLAEPIGPGDTLRVVNTSGRTTVQATDGSEARVLATTHYWSQDVRPEVRLTRSGSVVTLETVPPPGFLGGLLWVDYQVDLPPGVPVDVLAASGDVVVQGLAASVHAETASGDLDLRQITGPVTAQTASGEISLSDLSGELRATSVSGDIEGTGLTRIREVATTSGDVRLTGQFLEDATITSTSGEVDLRFAPGSSVRISATTTSGDLRVQGLPLADLRQDRRSLSGTLGAGAGVLTIRTTSGDVTLASAS